MIRLCADTKKPIADGYVFYNTNENGMDTYPDIKSEITLLCAYIQTGFTAGDSDDTEYVNNMCANQIFGLAPRQSWLPKKLNVPKVTHQCALRLLDVFDWGSKRLDKGNEWNMYFDKDSGWFCAGNPDFTGLLNVNFIQNAMAVLNENGEIKALWIKPVIRDDIPLTL
jgi:hypothetical protein